MLFWDFHKPPNQTVHSLSLVEHEIFVFLQLFSFCKTRIWCALKICRAKYLVGGKSNRNQPIKTYFDWMHKLIHTWRKFYNINIMKELFEKIDLKNILNFLKRIGLLSMMSAHVWSILATTFLYTNKILIPNRTTSARYLETFNCVLTNKPRLVKCFVWLRIIYIIYV